MQVQKLPLFADAREFFLFIFACGIILAYTLLIEYHRYSEIKHFDYTITNATVLHQYIKTKETKNGARRSHILKVKSVDGYSFYTHRTLDYPDVRGKTLQLMFWPQNLSFLSYMQSFYAYSRVLKIDQTPTLKQRLNTTLEELHTDPRHASIYKALYSASPMTSELYRIASNLGISHLFELSGFHLGVLSASLLLLFTPIYKFFQSRYFPYRSYKRDSFIFISITLLAYLLFVESPPSLLRAFVMLLIGFYLYDRGYKIISMQTLLLTVILILSFFPRLFFALGFWLSVAGVFYIFLFMIHFRDLRPLRQFILIPIWVYIMMLPLSLYIFENFSIYHPLSILWTALFTLFYPLSIALHLLGFADLLAFILDPLLALGKDGVRSGLNRWVLYSFILLSLIAIRYKAALWVLLLFSLGIFFYAFSSFL